MLVPCTSQQLKPCTAPTLRTDAPFSRSALTPCRPPAPRRRLVQSSGDGAPRPPTPHRVRPLLTVQPGTPLTQALGLLLNGGVSCLPVVDAHGVLLNIFARADIAMLAKVSPFLALLPATPFSGISSCHPLL